MKEDNHTPWRPMEAGKIEEIDSLFDSIYPAEEYGELKERITGYWIEMLKKVWEEKDENLKKLDLLYDPSDPLSRIQQKTVVISYADSVFKSGEMTLETLDNFLAAYFPAVRGLHMLPACQIAEGRFNDGYFSQVVRNSIHDRFGTNIKFGEMMKRYFSMTDFVLNHVDINNPNFQAYLQGNDDAGRCFFIFSEEEYQSRLSGGDFDQVFRPRPFPLFSLFRRKPEDSSCAALNHDQRVQYMAEKLEEDLPPVVINILFLFNKLRNDQMLLEEDYRHVRAFRNYLVQEKIDVEAVFTESKTQEVQHVPYIFTDQIKNRQDLLRAVGFENQDAERVVRKYEDLDSLVFGQEIRALTTFSHIQVDLNTATFEGLKMLADDFSWYLGMDLNMLRLDAANFAFKKWKTSCFGLPEVAKLMKVLYLSIDCVSPRMVANLEVNDQLSSVLKQMSDKNAPPPMMYDFHLASLLPAFFLNRNSEILQRIFTMIEGYSIPETSIRFSLAESHDGKSVRGSMDLLEKPEMQVLADTIEANGGKIKYKAVPGGREPYELCTSTRDSLPRLSDPLLEAERYLSFYTLAFALMGRNVKSIYFNDILGLPNDYQRCEESGELRDLKRTKSDFDGLAEKLAREGSFENRVAKGINNLIALTDSDPALHFRGQEAGVIIADTRGETAVIHNQCGIHHSVMIVNLCDRKIKTAVPLAQCGLGDEKRLWDNIAGIEYVPGLTGTVEAELTPFQRLWLTAELLSISGKIT